MLWILWLKDPLIIVLIFLFLLSKLLYIVTPILIALFIDDALRFNIFYNFQIYLMLLIFSTILAGITFPLSMLFFGYYKNRIFFKANNFYIKRLLDFYDASFQKEHSGKILSVLSSDLTIFYSFLSDKIFILPFDLMISFFAYYLIFNRSKMLTIFLILFGIIWSISSFLISKKIVPKGKELQERTGIFRKVIQEALSGFFTIKCFNTEDKIEKEIFNAQKNEIEMKSDIHILKSISQFFNHSGSRIVSLTIFFATGILILQNKSTIGELVLFLTIGQLSFTPFYYFITISKELSHSIGAYNHLKENLSFFKIEKGKKKLFHPSIEFKDVWFRYGEEYVIKGMSFKIGEDEKVSIVGRSGVGKSTMVNLILGFLEPEKGEVLIGGIDVREIDKDFLRGKIGIIPQDVFIFSWSLRDNITLGKEVDEERLKRVIEYTGIDRIIENMPEGLDTDLGERGARLSGGERQRIGIARVLLMEPEIVIFDEATSNLDSYSEEKIREFMEGWCKGRIIIVIAHRLSTIKKSERIIFIDNGKVEGEGRHKELMRNKRYKELFKGQLV